MEFILKGPERLNIYLTKEDLEAQNFSTAELYKDCADIKKRLSALFDTIKQKTGFNTDSTGLEIDIIPILGGDLLLSISKALMPFKTACFEFSELEDLFCACTQLYDKTRKSSVYKYGGGYVLIAEVATNDIYTLSEHGNLLQLRAEVIYEHGIPLIQNNALEVIQAYFS